ncbi:MAG: hypothetical protein R2879_17085 [Saprospiraceae bacterium]
MPCFGKPESHLLLYAIPLLAGLAVAHTFIPPTPGPVAVADILNADLGMVILGGIITGIPTILIAGVWFGKYIGNRIFVAPKFDSLEDEKVDLPSPYSIGSIIFVPIILILLNTGIKSGMLNIAEGGFRNFLLLIGHPFSALIIANLLAWYFLGLKKGYTGKELMKVSSKSMQAAGSIILLTGAGGAFKQVLVDSSCGNDCQQPCRFDFLDAFCLFVCCGCKGFTRISNAMITAAGLVAH